MALQTARCARALAQMLASGVATGVAEHCEHLTSRTTHRRAYDVVGAVNALACSVYFAYQLLTEHKFPRQHQRCQDRTALLAPWLLPAVAAYASCMTCWAVFETADAMLHGDDTWLVEVGIVVWYALMVAYVVCMRL